jgi:serine/threonine protein kinase
VYVGEAGDGRRAAIEVIPASVAHDATFRDRFRRDMAAARGVHSRYTAAVLDADADSDPAWIAFEYVEGPNLHDVVEAGPPGVPAAIGILTGIAEALVALHHVGVIHRGLKPTTVLCPPDGIKVIGYGVAGPTQGGVMAPLWLSPEQISDQSLTPAVDVFAWGWLAVYTLTGRLAFGGDDNSAPALIYRTVYAPPDLSGVPSELIEPISAALAKRPEDRPTVGDLVRLLPQPPANAAAVDDGPSGPGAGSPVPPPAASVPGAPAAGPASSAEAFTRSGGAGESAASEAAVGSEGPGGPSRSAPPSPALPQPSPSPPPPPSFGPPLAPPPPIAPVPPGGPAVTTTVLPQGPGWPGAAPPPLPPGGGWPGVPPGGPPGPAPGSERRVRLVVGIVIAVVVLIVVFAVIGAANNNSNGKRAVIQTTVPSSVPPGSTSPLPTAPPGVTPLAQLLPNDVDASADCSSNSTPPTLTGLTTALICSPKDLPGGQIFAFQFDSAADYASSLAALNRFKGFDPTTAGPTCPPAGDSQDQIGWHNDAFPTQNGQILECLSVGTNNSQPDYIWTYPTENAVIDAQGAANSAFSDLDTWWTKDAPPP